MADRTVSVKLSLEVAAYLANARKAELETKDLKEQIERLETAGSGMAKGGFIAMIAGLPGMASAAGAGIGLVSAAALSGAAAIGTLAVATQGVGDAFTAVAEGDADKLDEALAKLSSEARNFVAEYQRVKPALDSVGDATQSALFAQLAGVLEQLSDAYVPTLLRQMPELATALGRVGSGIATWASAPKTVSQVAGQVELATDLTEDFGRMLRAALGILLDVADASQDFTRDTVGGLADGVEGLEKWISTARATGQVNAILDNGAQILQRLGEFAAQAGVLLADVMDNPSLVDGAEALFDVLGITLDVVQLLLNAFEALPDGVQSGVVALAVFGGAASVVTSRVLTLKASLDAAKLSAVQAGTALRGVGSMLAGPWGIAIGAAAAAVAYFGSEQAEAKEKVRDLAGTLDEQTGAFTDSTRAMIANNLAASHALQTFEQMGVSADRVVDAALGDAAAMDELTAAIERYRNQDVEGNITRAQFALDEYLPEVKSYNGLLAESQKEEALKRRAVDATTGAIHGQVDAMRSLSEELRAQTDPAFALIKAQKDLSAAQTAYNEAVKEHGKNSAEAKAASLELAQASVVLAGAVETAGETFTGSLSPALLATLRAAGLTERQIDDIEAAFLAAAAAGDKFSGDYRARISVDTAAANRAIEETTLRLLAIKDKNVRIGVNAYWTNTGDLKVPSGTLTRRWGGITQHAQNGLLRDAGIYSPVPAGARYAFAEPATGGEAFVPKYGDYRRSMEILSEAARWYGARVTPAGSGEASTSAGSTYQRTINVYPQRANFGPGDLRTLENEADAYDRVRRAA